MESNPYPTYEEAARDYLAKCTALMEIPQKVSATGAWDGMSFSAEILVERTKEIAHVSAGMIRLAQGYLDSADLNTRQGIRYHFMAQCTVELLLGVGMIQSSKEKAGVHPTAANKVTWGAALVEALSDAEKALSSPVARGIPSISTYRDSESANAVEAAPGLELAIKSTLNNISQRVRELGGDIACDLVSGNEWDEVIRGAALSAEEIGTAVGSIHEGENGKILLNVYRKICALPDREAAGSHFELREWLNRIKQGEGVGTFGALVDGCYQLETLKKDIRAARFTDVPFERLNSDSDLVKGFADSFSFLVSCLRKLEDAIRLAKSIDIPQFRLLRIALQVALLSALISTGQEYINRTVRHSAHSSDA